MKGVRKPPSLLNILKEVQSDTGAQMPDHGNLGHWAQQVRRQRTRLLPPARCRLTRLAQGVLLLNTVLTVRKATPNSHAKRGWEQFTDAVIRTVNQERRGVVFLLWGKPAQVRRASALCRAAGLRVLTAASPLPCARPKQS